MIKRAIKYPGGISNKSNNKNGEINIYLNFTSLVAVGFSGVAEDAGGNVTPAKQLAEDL